MISGIVTKTFLFMLFITMLACGNAFSQIREIKVNKVACKNLRNDLDGYKLVVTLAYKDSSIATSAKFYWLKALEALPDSVKLAIIGELLKFKNDSSLCCLNVEGHYYEGVERTCRIKPASKRYTIQIDALYMINKIVFPEGISLCACFPVVINWQTKAELNERPELIAAYYKVYEAWWKKALKMNKIDPVFPFNTKKYAWFGAYPESIQ